MRTFGGRLPEGFKEETSSFTASSGFPESISGSKCQQLWLRVSGWSNQQTLGEQLPTDGRYENRPGNALDSHCPPLP